MSLSELAFEHYLRANSALVRSWDAFEHFRVVNNHLQARRCAEHYLDERIAEHRTSVGAPRRAGKATGDAA